MTPRIAALVWFAGGVVLGILLGIAASRFGRGKAESYVLKQDLDLAQTYFFQPKPSPAAGIIKAGSKLDVVFRYSNADYVEIRTVIDRETLRRMTERLPPESGR